MWLLYSFPRQKLSNSTLSGDPKVTKEIKFKYMKGTDGSTMGFSLKYAGRHGIWKRKKKKIAAFVTDS